MKRSFADVLFVIIALPLFIVGSMSYQIIVVEQSHMGYHFDKVFLQRLQSADASISEKLSGLRNDLRRDLSFQNLSLDTIKHNLQNHRFIKQAILLDKDGQKISFTVPRTREEKRVVNNFDNIASDIKVSIKNETISNNAQKKQSSFSNFVIKKKTIEKDGWHIWFQNKGLALIFWKYNQDGDLIVAEINRSALLGYIIASLPSYTPRFHEERITLTDEKGRELYMWGGVSEILDKRISEEKQPAQVTLSLSFPLNMYKFQYYTTATPNFSKTLFLQLFLQLGTITIILCFLCWYIYSAMTEARKKVNFVNQVSHELKTPLTNIRMYAELLDNHMQEDDNAVKKLSIIQSECQRLSQLINNVLSFSNQNSMSLKIERQNVDALVQQIVESFRPVFNVKGIAVKLDLNAGECSFDRNTLEQVLINLINNVEKYAADGKLLEIKTWQAQGKTHIQVKDNGTGIPLLLRTRIFEPFFRAHDSITEGVSGTGIGLSLAKDLMRRSGGDLRLVDQKQGACFEVIL